MKIIKFIPLIALLLLSAAQIEAQKVGHLDSQALLAQMPQIKTANSQLETFSKKKEEELSEKGKEIESFYMNTLQEQQNGTLSPLQLQQKEVDLQKMQNDLQQMQLKAEQDIVNKQEELYVPIYNKVNDAIKSVAEENNYDYILDSGTGFVIHFKESEDVTKLVKAKLGL